MASKRLAGIFPPITTPFSGKSRSLDLGKLAENFQKWSKTGLAGYVVLGSNGEFPFLTRNEKLELMSTARDLTPKDKLLIAGAGLEGTNQTVNLCNDFGKIGVDAVLIITPCFYKNAMTSDALKQHYLQVADESAVPVILYSVPANTSIDLSADLVISLSTHPNIVGLKDSGGDITKLTRIVAETKSNNFQVLAGSAGFLLPAFQIGCVGGICASANCIPDPLVELYKEFHTNGSSKKALDLQARIIAPNAAVTRGLGVSGLKHMMDKMGYYGGPVRSPLLPLSPDQEKNVEQCFERYRFFKD